MGTDEIPLERPVSLSVSSEISCLTAATKQAKLVATGETIAVKNIKENANIITFPVRNICFNQKWMKLLVSFRYTLKVLSVM